MRVTGGILVRKPITNPRHPAIRSMTDRVRQSIFNTLGNDLSGQIVLDLYSGSGSLGIEALSRGAKFVLFVEKNFKAVDTIKKNLTSLNLEDKSTVSKSDVHEFLKQAKTKFDLIFIDPPYNLLDLKVVEKTYNLLKLDGLVVLSTSSQTALPNQIGRLKLIKSKKFGGSRISYFQR